MVSKKLDFIKRVKDAALAASESVLSHWLPDGKRNGDEWQALNPKRPDNKPGSFSINLITGVWADFATGDKGGDLVSLIAYLDGCRQGEAAKRLGSFLGISETVGNVGDSGDNTPQSPTRRAKGENQDSAGRGGKAGDVPQITPIPAQFKPLPATHRTHGKATAAYVYRDRDGLPIQYIRRFDPPGKRKQFIPYTFHHGKPIPKALPAPRPLYHLDLIHNNPAAPVLVCEGEKAADAAAVLLPDCITTTPPNGAKAPKSADWSPLQGRDVLIWPDADEPGAAFADAVAGLAWAAGARSVKVQDLRAMLTLPNGTTREQLPKGWDAADALDEGWEPDTLPVKWIEQARPDTKANNKTTARPAHSDRPGKDDRPYFKPSENGVYYLGIGNDKDTGEAVWLPPQWICSQLYINAYTRDERGENWGRLLEFLDRDGTPHRWAMPMLLLKGSGEEVRGELLRLGVEIATSPQARRLLGDYLQQWRPDARARCVSRTGWFGSVYVMPERTIGEDDERIIFQTEHLCGFTYRERGTLGAWRTHVAGPCISNSRLVFALSVAFAALLVEPADDESGGFHFRGGSSSGKTTALKVAASVFGAPDFMQRWRATDNGLEALAEQHNDALLILDELAQIEPRAAGETAYMLANGSGKARAGRTGMAREVKRWRLLFLSAGELGLAEHMAQVNKKAKAGQEIRMADIPADAGQGLGLFDTLGGFESGAALARALTDAAASHYGTASLAFIGNAIKRRAELPGKIRQIRAGFVSEALAGRENSGQAERVAARFGLVAVAGELATAWGITGWQPGEAENAARVCFEAWANARGGTGRTEEAALLAQVRHFFEMHGESRFTPYDRATDDHAPRTSNRAGFVRHDGGRFIFYVLPEVFRREICEGFDHREAEQILVDKGWMKPGNDSRGHQRRESLPGYNSRARCYVFDVDDWKE